MGVRGSEGSGGGDGERWAEPGVGLKQRSREGASRARDLKLLLEGSQAVQASARGLSKLTKGRAGLGWVCEGS